VAYLGIDPVSTSKFLRRSNKMDNFENKETLKDNFPSNSNNRIRSESVPIADTKIKVEKITVGAVKRQKRSFAKKAADTFLSEDVANVKGYVLHDILIPAAKALLSDVVNGGLNMILFGDNNRGRLSTRREVAGRTSRTNYNSLSDDRYSRDRDRTPAREISRVARSRHDFDEIILETRGEAENVLSRLADLIAEYDQATVADLYDMVDISSDFPDNKHGWTSIKGSRATRVRNGWLLDLPRTEVLLD
jgi:hypothetical protein